MTKKRRGEGVSQPYSFRNSLSPTDRSIEAEPYIDPGFVNKRLANTVVGEEGIKVIDDAIARLPDLPDYLRDLRIDHIYTELMLAFCKMLPARNLEEALTYPTNPPAIVASTCKVMGCENFYELERASNVCDPHGHFPRKAVLEYTQKQVRSDTLRSKLQEGAQISFIAEVHEVQDEKVILHPIVMGFPWVKTQSLKWREEIMWHNYEFFENFPEDFREFEKIKSVPQPEDFQVMKNISENAIKQCLSKILAENAGKDWGGETSDLFTTHLHLGEKRVSAAFLLKGPARFAPMDLNHLGKNNDQILRLAREPADVLIVQHSHDILPAVRETLRTFAVRPHLAKRYCLIDGRDSLRILQAYDLVETALKMSQKSVDG